MGPTLRERERGLRDGVGFHQARRAGVGLADQLAGERTGLGKLSSIVALAGDRGSESHNNDKPVNLMRGGRVCVSN